MMVQRLCCSEDCPYTITQLNQMPFEDLMYCKNITDLIEASKIAYRKDLERDEELKNPGKR